MSRAAAILALLVGGAVLIGCGKDEGPPPEPNVAKPPKEDANAAAAKAAAAAAKEAQAALAEVLALIKDGKLDEADAKLKALEATSATLPADMQGQIKAARTSLDAAKAAKAADAAKAAALQDAQTSLQKVLALIKEGKLDEADAELKALEAKSGSLPEAMQGQIKAARTSLDAAKAAKAADAAKAAALQGAQTSLQKVLALIKEGKLDEADAELKALEAKSGSLPEAMQGQIKAARTSLDAAKAAKKAAAANQEAESLLARILALIKEAKLADAEKLLKTLEEKSGSLSPEMQAKIKAARTTLTAKKAVGGGIKLLSLPG